MYYPHWHVPMCQLAHCQSLCWYTIAYVHIITNQITKLTTCSLFTKVHYSTLTLNKAKPPNCNMSVPFPVASHEPCTQPSNHLSMTCRNSHKHLAYIHIHTCPGPSSIVLHSLSRFQLYRSDAGETEVSTRPCTECWESSRTFSR